MRAGGQASAGSRGLRRKVDGRQTNCQASKIDEAHTRERHAYTGDYGNGGGGKVRDSPRR